MSDDDALEKNPGITETALAELHDQFFGWALSRCNYEREAAEDLMQQAYVELLTGKAIFKQRSSLKTFVFSVIQNLSRARFRRLSARFRMTQKVALDGVGQVAAPSSDTDRAVVWNAVQKLPGRQRDVIELVFCRDLTIEEAAGVMSVSLGTARVHYDRAKKALREQIDGTWANDFYGDDS